MVPWAMGPCPWSMVEHAFDIRYYYHYIPLPQSISIHALPEIAASPKVDIVLIPYPGSVVDGQKNVIKFIPFVCPSSIPTTAPHARARSPWNGSRRTDELDKIYPIRLSVIYP
jgi:hypothetical protein